VLPRRVMPNGARKALLSRKVDFEILTASRTCDALLPWFVERSLMVKNNPAAFMSYVHLDDKNERLTAFSISLGEEVRVQTGEQFLIFQDRRDIKWGQNWKKRIEESLNRVTFLIAFITPSSSKVSIAVMSWSIS
jgi:hypothetical protein